MKVKLTESGWNTNDDTRTKLVSEVDFVSWVALDELNARNGVSDFDHDCDC